DGADSLWWNPAGLAYVARPEAGFEQSRWLEQFGLYGLQAAAPVPSVATFGLGVLYADYGTFNLVDNTGATQFGQYSAADLLAAGGAARSWDDGRWSLGAAGKLIQEHIESERAEGVAFDLGGRFHQDAWSAAAVVQNMGPGLSFVGQSSPMPTTLRLGGAWTPLAGLTASLDVVRPYDASFSERFGFEYKTPAYRGLQAAVRLGYSTLASAFTGLTYGFGVDCSRGSFDFAVAPSPTGEQTSWIGVTARFGSWRSAPSAAAAAAEPARDRRPPAKVLADVMAWYRRKVAEGVLSLQDRADVLRRILAEFAPQGVDVSGVQAELDALTPGAR
ncbi:MAG TPA: PorV/PorQ family protein, partial [Elusimicrobiota bacterium]|nr:PorV/PorQ family protein [Elusimicrobiota bacterium]